MACASQKRKQRSFGRRGIVVKYTLTHSHDKNSAQKKEMRRSEIYFWKISFSCYPSAMIHIEQDEDGVYVGSVPSIPSCHAQGDTQEKMLKNLVEVKKLCLRNSADKYSELRRN